MMQRTTPTASRRIHRSSCDAICYHLWGAVITRIHPVHNAQSDSLIMRNIRMFTLTRPWSLSTQNTRLTRRKISAASVLGCTGQLVSMEPASRPSPVCKLRRRPWTVCAVDNTKCRLKKCNPRCVLLYTITKEGASLGVCAYDKCGNCRESKTNISIRMKIKSVAV
jgi:hypothetical protein